MRRSRDHRKQTAETGEDAGGASSGTATVTDGATLLDAQKENVDHLAEISRNARATFLALLLACAYCYLTLGTTTDATLLSNSAESVLPIIQASVPVVWFYYFAPILVTLVFLYFHLYLLRFWRGVTALPLVHPDGRSLDDYVYPWLISSAVLRAGNPRLRPDKGRLVLLESMICIFLAWWFVPVMLLFFWARFLTRHDWLGTTLHVLVISLAVTAAVGFLESATSEVRLVGKQASSDGGRWSAPHLARAVFLGLATAGTLFFISLGAIEGAPRAHCEHLKIPPCELRFVGVRALETVGYHPFANFDEKQLSGRSPTWNGSVDAAELNFAGVVGAGLKSRDLRHAHGRQAFLVKADLRDADLRWSYLDGSRLQGADLTGAKLNDASLVEADLRKALLKEADLTAVDLNQADLRRADLSKAALVDTTLEHSNLSDAIGKDANLTGANLRWADLAHASFEYANFSNAQLQSANLFEAKLARSTFDDASLESANLEKAELAWATFQQTELIRANLLNASLFQSKFPGATLNWATLNGVKAVEADFAGASLVSAKLRGAVLRQANFKNADLADADLTDSDLRQADFAGADLTATVLAGTDLSGAVLTNVVGLEQRQLNLACGNEETKVASGFEVPSCRKRYVAEQVQ